MHKMVGWEGERGERGESDMSRHSPSAYFEGLLVLLSTLLICKNTSNVEE